MSQSEMAAHIDEDDLSQNQQTNLNSFSSMNAEQLHLAMREGLCEPLRNRPRRHQICLHEGAGMTKQLSDGNHTSQQGIILLNNLPPRVIHAQLTELFDRYGEIVDQYIVYDKFDKPTGQALVVFSERQCAIRAINSFIHVIWDGEALEMTLVPSLRKALRHQRTSSDSIDSFQYIEKSRLKRRRHSRSSANQHCQPESTPSTIVFCVDDNATSLENRSSPLSNKSKNLKRKYHP